MDEFDYDSTEEESFATFSLPATQTGRVGTAAVSPVQVDMGIMNSTMAAPTSGGLQSELHQRLVALETMAQMRSAPSLDSVVIGQNIGRTVGELMKSTASKRSRSPDGAPEPPVTEVVDVKGTDDNHKTFCWPLRRAYKNPNSKPEDYWEEAKYPLKSVPNLRGNLYLDHLVPMSVSGKALGWAHNATTQLEIKYFTAANRTVKRNKKEGLKITSGAGEGGETHYSVDEAWEEADTIKDLLDGLFNLAAATFQIRPWDWSPLVILRVSHECGYFSGCSKSRQEQKRILEEFINECLFKGRTRIGQGSPPLNYQECYVVAETTVSDINGRRHEISRGKGVYGGRWDMAAKDDEISKLTIQLAQARSDNTQLRQTIKHSQLAGNSYNPTGAKKGRSNAAPRGGGKNKNKGSQDSVFTAKRALMCVKFNQHTCTDAACPSEHACSRWVSQGTPCGQGHPAKEHQ